MQSTKCRIKEVNKMTVNAKLREFLEKEGIKQSFICEQTGMSPDAVSRILNSNRKITAEEFLNICTVLKLDPRDFLKTA